MSDVTIPFALGDVPERARECGVCSPSIQRCAHFGDISIHLADVRRTTPKGWAIKIPEHFLVSRVTSPADHAPSGGPYIDRCFYKGDDYAEALAAFHEAEERLLRGELS